MDKMILDKMILNGQNGIQKKMVLDKMVYGQSYIGQNGMDKMILDNGQNRMDKMMLDKMVLDKMAYRQNGTGQNGIGQNGIKMVCRQNGTDKITLFDELFFEYSICICLFCRYLGQIIQSPESQRHIMNFLSFIGRQVRCRIIYDHVGGVADRLGQLPYSMGYTSQGFSSEMES